MSASWGSRRTASSSGATRPPLNDLNDGKGAWFPSGKMPIIAPARSRSTQTSNHVVALADVGHAVALPIDRHLVEAVHDVPGNGIQNTSARVSSGFVSERRSMTPGGPSCHLVVAHHDGWRIVLGKMESMRTLHPMVAGNSRPNQDAGQPVIQMRPLDRGVKTGFPMSTQSCATGLAPFQMRCMAVSFVCRSGWRPGVAA